MQTLTQNASRFVCWDQIDLPNGVYRIQNARMTTEAPDLTGWIDCSSSWQFQDEVKVALEMLGEACEGIWVGMGGAIHGVCTGIAWLAC